MGNPAIAAIVLQYGHWERTAESVRSLLDSELPPRWIIIVDNASPDDSCAKIGQWLASTDRPLSVIDDSSPLPSTPLVLLTQARNGGYAAGNNAGMRLALKLGADAVLILNNDARLAPSALGHMWNTLKNTPNAGLCGAKIVYPLPDSPLQCCAGGFTNYLTGLSTFTGEGLTLATDNLSRDQVEKNLNFICGACVLASRKFIEDVGLLDEGYFLYCEEQDWALRAAGRFGLVYAPEAICIHDEGTTTGWNRRTFHWKLGLRLLQSRLRLCMRHHPPYLPTVVLGCLFAAGRLLLKKLPPQYRSQPWGTKK